MRVEARDRADEELLNQFIECVNNNCYNEADTKQYLEPFVAEMCSNE